MSGLRQSLAEARAIMEGAYGLREEVLLNLLGQCTSVKTVRLCLMLSRELSLPFADVLLSADLPTKGKGAWVSKPRRMAGSEMRKEYLDVVRLLVRVAS